MLKSSSSPRNYYGTPWFHASCPVAAAGTAEENRQVVAHKLAERLVKTGGRLVKHARYYWLLLAESQLTRRLFESIVRRIELLPGQRDKPDTRGSGLE